MRMRLDADELYRWAREGRLPAVKLGREWRVRPSDVEQFAGEGGVLRGTEPSWPHGARSEPSTHEGRSRAGTSPARDEIGAGEPDPATEPDRPPTALTPPAVREGASRDGLEALEQRMAGFIQPRDRMLLIASDQRSLARVQDSFWRLASLSGDQLLLPRPHDRVKPTLEQLASTGIGEAHRGHIQVLPVSSDSAALDAVLSAATAGRAVWACFGLASELSDSLAAVREQADRLAAASVTHNVVSLTAVFADEIGTEPLSSWIRIEAAHRGTIRTAGGEILLSRSS